MSDGLQVALKWEQVLLIFFLLKFVKAKITGDARSKLMVRDLTHSWEQVKAILGENYATRRTLDYACKMFSARQSKNESIASWGNKIDELQTDYVHQFHHQSIAHKLQERRGPHRDHTVLHYKTNPVTTSNPHTSSYAHNTLTWRTSSQGSPHPKKDHRQSTTQ